MTQPMSFDEFLRAVGKALEKDGWRIVFCDAETEGYDIEATKPGWRVAVRVVAFQRSCGVPHVQKFLDFLALPESARFRQGLLISQSGFSSPALALVEQLGESNLKLATVRDGKLDWSDLAGGERRPKPVRVRAPSGKTYIGVFTCKGGVGKTTISAHLAGAFALMQYDVALVDLDPQRNLNLLLPEGVYVPKPGGGPGATISVYYAEDWDARRAPERIVICDCSPDFDSNPTSLLKKFDYCLIPTTLNPLGINKNGIIIEATLKRIRKINRQAQLFVLINAHYDDDTMKSQVLKTEFRRLFAELEDTDSRFHFIDPDECAIRNSKLLFYWGYHLYSDPDGPGRLAFTPVGGRCLPKENFLRLVEYLEEHTDVDEMKSVE